MSKDGGKLPLAGLLECQIFHIGLAAEEGELGNSLEEVVVRVDRIGLREASSPFSLWEDELNALNVGEAQVVLFDGTISCLG